MLRSDTRAMGRFFGCCMDRLNERKRPLGQCPVELVNSFPDYLTSGGVVSWGRRLPAVLWPIFYSDWLTATMFLFWRLIGVLFLLFWIFSEYSELLNV